jgi:hypothetical protein
MPSERDSLDAGLILGSGRTKEERLKDEYPILADI